MFAVGLVLGIGGMYLAGVRPQSQLAVCEGVPNIAGLSGAGLVTIKDNKAVKSAQLVVTLSGVIQEIGADTIVLMDGASVPITVTVGDRTSITSEVKDGEETSVFKFQDLQQYEFVQIFGHLEGDKISADNITRSITPRK